MEILASQDGEIWENIFDLNFDVHLGLNIITINHHDDNNEN